MAYRESLFALLVAKILLDFVEPRNLGLVSGADGTMKLFGGLVRIPDVAFASWGRIPGRVVPKEPIPDLTPDLVVEVLSESNTLPRWNGNDPNTLPPAFGFYGSLIWRRGS